MADPMPMKKGKKTPKSASASKAPFEAQVDFLDGLQIIPDGAKEAAPGQAGAPAVVTRLIDFIKKM